MMGASRVRARGLSLLEMLVAISIMAIALAMLYKASGASARQAGDIGHYQRAIMLAESILDAKDAVDAQGWNEEGQSAGFLWSVTSHPFETESGRADLSVPALVSIQIHVMWTDDGTPRLVELNTLRPVRRSLAGALVQ